MNHSIEAPNYYPKTYANDEMIRIREREMNMFVVYVFEAVDNCSVRPSLCAERIEWVKFRGQSLLTFVCDCCKRCLIFGRFDNGNEILSRTAVAVAING